MYSADVAGLPLLSARISTEVVEVPAAVTSRIVALPGPVVNPCAAGGQVPMASSAAGEVREQRFFGLRLRRLWDDERQPGRDCQRGEGDQRSETASRRAIPPPLNLGEHVFGSSRLTEIRGLVIPLLPFLVCSAQTSTGYWPARLTPSTSANLGQPRHQTSENILPHIFPPQVCYCICAEDAAVGSLPSSARTAARALCFTSG